MPQKTIYTRQADFDLYADLKTLAVVRGVSESEIIAEALRQYLNHGLNRHQITTYREQFTANR